jgi:hypothetical protein
MLSGRGTKHFFGGRTFSFYFSFGSFVRSEVSPPQSSLFRVFRQHTVLQCVAINISEDLISPKTKATCSVTARA